MCVCVCVGGGGGGGGGGERGRPIFIGATATTNIYLYLQHTKYAKVFVFSVCLSVCLLTFILCQRYFRNYFT